VNVFTNNSVFRRALATWTDPTSPVPRRTYVTHGVVLAAVKYAGDMALVYAATRTLWTPFRYVDALPALLVRAQTTGAAPWWLAPALASWMLPFLVLGLTLTLRRALDAGRSPWWSTLFLVPYVNYALILALSAMPSRPRGRDEQRPPHWGLPRGAAVLLAVGAGTAVAAGAVIFGLVLLAGRSNYGAWLFLLTPFAMGACTTFVYNCTRAASAGEAPGLVAATFVTSGVLLIAVAVEGLICLIMSLPLSIPLAVLGGAAGRRAAASAGAEHPLAAMFMLMAIPLTAAVEPPAGVAIHEVRSSVVIDAPPAAVWPHVIAFREIPPPDDWIFRAGVAYPIRAHIDGTGVGAIRYCVFSTGAFVEPITQWEPGRRLSFDVVESPATMRELSPYRDLSPPHLHGFFRAKRGEFRFVDLGGGRTRLEGSTWYQIEMAPEAYWEIFADALIHRIHQRVLDHIKREVEAG
jgi:hypothetical protein